VADNDPAIRGKLTLTTGVSSISSVALNMIAMAGSHTLTGLLSVLEWATTVASVFNGHEPLWFARLLCQSASRSGVFRRLASIL
jgi:hypothetical protein